MAEMDRMAGKTKSDVRTVLLNLVNKQSMPEFDYAGTKFTFDTVFYFQSAFFSNACNCGVALERLEFINSSGNVIEHVFESMVDCITKGECPHVIGVPKRDIQRATLYAMHIVAAVGCIAESEAALDKKPFAHYRGEYTLLGIGTFEIAMLRQGIDNLIVNRESVRTQSLINVSKELDLTVSQSEYMEFDRRDLISYCIEKKYHALLSDIVQQYKRKIVQSEFRYGMFDMDIALQTALHQKSTELVDIIVNEPHREKTGFLPRRKQRRRSASR